MKKISNNQNGFTLVEVLVVLVLLTLSFMIFLNALNTGKTVRAKSELRTIQSTILNSIENQIRSRRFDENLTEPWSIALGQDTGESLVTEFDDIDDFDGYVIAQYPEHAAFRCDVSVNYVSTSTGFHVFQSDRSNYKSVMVKISHGTLPAMTDTMIIGSGL